MNTWTDFNDAEQQQGFDLIPKGTTVKVRMTIKPGGHDDPAQGWTGGYATESFDTGSVYLACEFVVLDGPFAKPTWGQMGRSMIRGILNSARNVHPQDNSPQAASARRIQGFHELDGIEFLARVDVEKDAKGEDRNVVKLVVEPDHKDYAALMGVPSKSHTGGGSAVAPAPAAPQQANAQRPAVPGKPAWAQ